MTVLVTGANGGVGRLLLPLLRTYYNEPVVCTGRAKIDGEDYFICDLTDVRAVASVIKTVRPSLIYHLRVVLSADLSLTFRLIPSALNLFSIVY